VELGWSLGDSKPLTSCMPCLAVPSGGVACGRITTGQRDAGIWVSRTVSLVIWSSCHWVCHCLATCPSLESGALSGRGPWNRLGLLSAGGGLTARGADVAPVTLDQLPILTSAKPNATGASPWRCLSYEAEAPTGNGTLAASGQWHFGRPELKHYAARF
jgi:hypothetical protein